MKVYLCNSGENVLRWKLRVLMAERKVSNKELAQVLDVHPASISRMKASDKMPKIDGDTLETICKVLKCNPFDLIEYVPDGRGKTAVMNEEDVA